MNFILLYLIKFNIFILDSLYQLNIIKEQIDYYYIQLLYIYNIPMGYLMFKLNNINLILNFNLHFDIKKIVLEFNKKNLLTPSLEIYYPIISSIISITIRITGLFAIILTCCIIF